MTLNSPLDPAPIPPEAVRGRPTLNARHVGPPPGVSDDECGTVEALVGHVAGYPAWCDYWRPTPEQLATLNAGGFIELVQYSPRMVMHSLSVWTPDPIETLHRKLTDPQTTQQTPDFPPAATITDAVGPHGHACPSEPHEHGETCGTNCVTCYCFGLSEQGPYLVSPANPDNIRYLELLQRRAQMDTDGGDRE